MNKPGPGHKLTFFYALAAMTLTACGGDDAPANAGNTAAPEPAAQEAPATSADAVGQVLRTALGGDFDAWYFDATYDLDGDGDEEVIAYVAGAMVCGTGGCPVYVLTPTSGGYEVASEISIARPPVQVSSARNNGWHDLIVHVSGGGIGEAYDAQLPHDGSAYASNPTVAPAEPAGDLADSITLIPDFASASDGKPVPAATR